MTIVSVISVSKVSKMYKSSVVIVIFCLSLCQCLGLAIIESEALEPYIGKDYRYVRELGAFYKLHPQTHSWYEAYKQCKTEGGSLFYPKSEVEANQLLQRIEFAPGDMDMWVGAHQLFSSGIFVDLNGTGISTYYDPWAEHAAKTGDCVSMNRDGTITARPCEGLRTFVCEKNSHEVVFDEICGTSYSGYIPNKELGSCYKVYKQPESWSQAYATCYNEGSHLVIINDRREADFIYNTVSPIVPTIPGTFNRRWTTVGIHNRFLDNEFMTIYGEDIDEVYSKWLDGEPNDMGDEKCGSLDIAPGRDPLLNDLNCDHEKTVFVCERDIAKTDVQSATNRAPDTTAQSSTDKSADLITDESADSNSDESTKLTTPESADSTTDESANLTSDESAHWFTDASTDRSTDNSVTNRNIIPTSTPKFYNIYDYDSLSFYGDTTYN